MNIEEEEYSFVRSPDSVEACGLGPCIAVGYLNRTRMEAGLLHSASATQTSQLDRFLKEAVALTETNDIIEIVLCGGENSRRGSVVAKNRAAVLRALQNAFPGTKVTTHWNDAGYSSMDMRISTAPPLIVAEPA